MESQHFVVGSPFGEKKVAKSLHLKGLLEAAEEILKQAGCDIIRTKGTTDTIINYPAGTTRQELFPRTLESRYRVLLPDGLELREIASRANGCVGLSMLQETLLQRAPGEETAE